MSSLLIGTILPAVISALVLPLLTYLGIQLTNLIKTKVANQALAGFLEHLSTFALTSVQATAQTTVDAAAKAANGGKLAPEVAAAAKAAALESLKAAVSLSSIMAAFNCTEQEANKIAEVQIEAAVMKQKMATSNRIQPLTPAL